MKTSNNSGLRTSCHSLAIANLDDLAINMGIIVGQPFLYNIPCPTYTNFAFLYWALILFYQKSMPSLLGNMPRK